MAPSPGYGPVNSNILGGTLCGRNWDTKFLEGFSIAKAIKKHIEVFSELLC